jgi:AcrR family transcriptional regulator
MAMQDSAADKNVRTRDKLVSTARALFAERGVEAVSLREISRDAGQGNVSALQYHFGDRASLLGAVLDPHNREVDARRAALLDDIEARGELHGRVLAAALVRPAAAMLDSTAGREYLRIVGGISNRSDIASHLDTMLEESPSMARWRRMVAGCISEEGIRLHRRFTAYQLSAIELGRRAELGNRRDHRLFSSHLIDLCAAIIDAPTSEETKSLLSENRKRRSAKN